MFNDPPATSIIFVDRRKILSFILAERDFLALIEMRRGYVRVINRYIRWRNFLVWTLLEQLLAGSIEVKVNDDMYLVGCSEDVVSFN